MHKHVELIKKYKVNESDFTKSIRTSLAEFKKLELGYQSGLQKLQDKQLSAEAKQKLQETVDEAKNTLEQLDIHLAGAIEKWYPNRDRYKDVGQRLKKGRENAAAKNGQSAGNDAPPKPDASTAQDPPKQDPPKQDPPKQDPPKQDPPKTATTGKTDEQKKKKNVTNMILFGALALLTGGILWVSQSNKSK